MDPENSQELSAKPSLLSIFGGFILGMLALALFLLVPQHFSQTSKNKPAKETKVSGPSFEGAKTIFAVAATPSARLLTNLENAHQSGSQVRLVTATPVAQTSFQTVIVPPGRILRDAILIDGTAWYPLSRETTEQ